MFFKSWHTKKQNKICNTHQLHSKYKNKNTCCLLKIIILCVIYEMTEKSEHKLKYGYNMRTTKT